LNSVVTPLEVSKALADETRLRIFQAICATGHMNCGEMVSRRRVTLATVSHHLRILSDAGLIVCLRKGKRVYCDAVPDTIAAYMRAIAKIGPRRKSAGHR
jgi:ArsR family transcriptional regulator